MLVLSRKVGEIIDIGGGIELMVVRISDDKVKIGVSAPKDVKINRREVTVRIEQEGKHRE